MFAFFRRRRFWNALAGGDVEGVRQLLANDPILWRTQSEGMSPLFLVASQGPWELVRSWCGQGRTSMPGSPSP